MFSLYLLAFFLSFRFISFVCMSVLLESMSGYHVYPRTGVVNSFEHHQVGAGNQTWTSAGIRSAFNYLAISPVCCVCFACV